MVQWAVNPPHIIFSFISTQTIKLNSDSAYVFWRWSSNSVQALSFNQFHFKYNAVLYTL